MSEKLSNSEKIHYIQRSLLNGVTRDEIALKLGYHNWRGLDIFMRRQGMKWDPRKKNYYLVPEDKEEPHAASDMPPKIVSIIAMFEKDGADPREIAKQAGFENHREMATYMSARGYIWSAIEKNYVKSPDGNKTIQEESSAMNASTEASVCSDSPDLAKYLPILEMLAKHQEKLAGILVPELVSIPRYMVPGTTRTKSFYMSEKLSNLIYEFSRARNISQKEIIEAALIDFLKRYSFEKEVVELLNKN